MARPCERELVRRLAAHGGWVGRRELAAGIGWHVTVVDDDLAGMVERGDVLYNARSGEYRLAGTLWGRRALRELVRNGTRRAAVAGPAPNRKGFHVGMATRTPQADGGDALLMAELELPDCTTLEQRLALAVVVAKWAGAAEATP